MTIIICTFPIMLIIRLQLRFGLFNNQDYKYCKEIALTWKRPWMISSCCLVILVCRRVMSPGCLALNGYVMHRDMNTYS